MPVRYYNPWRKRAQGLIKDIQFKNVILETFTISQQLPRGS